MSIQPEIRTIPSFRLIGMSQRQSLVQNTTAALWKRFGDTAGVELRSVSDGVLYSLEVYDGLDHFAVFDPARNSRSGPRWKSRSRKQSPMDERIARARRSICGLLIVAPLLKARTCTATSFTQWLPAPAIRSMTDRTLPGWMSGIGRSRGSGRGDLGAGAIGAYVAPCSGIFEKRRKRSMFR